MKATAFYAYPGGIPIVQQSVTGVVDLAADSRIAIKLGKK